MKTDIEIAQSVKAEPIEQIAKKLGIPEKHLDAYGKFKAKINPALSSELSTKPDGKLILVTAISPTPAGEGKTTTLIGLADALSRLGKKTCLALREPSLGPVFGVKGGAAGGGYAQVLPMDEINLHFNGDFHAITSANNLLAAMIDNHIFQGNALKIDTQNIVFRRCMDMNDRALRGSFDITAASEVMATLCLAADLDDLKVRLGRIIVGYDVDGKPVTAAQLKCQGAMAALLKEAIKPNLVQTLEHTPTLIHGGPFANIAHGCNSVIATRLALKLGDYTVTEAGFGADLGAEKFLNIKCRTAKLKPAAVVLVATVRALKHHGGGNLSAGIPNLTRHIENITKQFGLPVVVAVNRFPTDTEEELASIAAECKKLGVSVALSEVWAKGGEGGLELAKEVIRIADSEGKKKAVSAFKFTYPDSAPIKEKLLLLAQKIYRADSVKFTDTAEAQIKKLEDLGYGKLPVCVAKTQYSFSDDPTKLGAPTGFDITVKSVKVSAGAGFVVALTGEIMTMPGLPKIPAAENIDIDNYGKIKGLF